MLVEVSDLRTKFNITASAVSNDAFEECIADASRMLRSWVGSDAYDDADSADPDDEDRFDALQSAEGYLAMYHALLNSGARIRANGLVKGEQDAAGPGAGTIVNQYYTPDELIALRQEYFQQAETLAAIYRQGDGGTGIGAGTISMRGGWAN